MKKGIASTLAAGLVLALLLLAVMRPVSAATLRGRLESKDSTGRRHPAAGLVVTALNKNGRRSLAAHSGRDGMYYLQVPAGQYRIEVWVSLTPGAKPVVYPQIWVKEPYTDAPPIVVP